MKIYSITALLVIILLQQGCVRLRRLDDLGDRRVMNGATQ